MGSVEATVVLEMVAAVVCGRKVGLGMSVSVQVRAVVLALLVLTPVLPWHLLFPTARWQCIGCRCPVKGVLPV